MLAYDSVQKCKDDLLAYKLIIQSVPVALESSTNTTKSSHLNSTTSSTKSLSKQTFEDVLDCKSCSIQAL